MKTAIKIIIGLYTIAVSIKNIKFRRLLKRDCKNIERYLSELAENCINTVSLEDLENLDDRKPIKPIPIYVYD